MTQDHSGFDMVKLQESVFYNWGRVFSFKPGLDLLDNRIGASSKVDWYLLQAMFVGMHDEALAPIRKGLALMEEYGPPSGTEPEPPNQLYSSRDKAIKWWIAFGLGRWIVGRGDGVEEFAGAADHVHQQWQGDDPGPFVTSVLIGLASHRYQMVEWICQQCLSETGRLVVPEDDRPMAELARWMAKHLAAGGARDARFVARAEAALRAWYDIPKYVSWGGLALWLKVIYWESGLTKTPAETFLRLYEVLPQIEKPDFSKRPEMDQA